MRANYKITALNAQNCRTGGWFCYLVDAKREGRAYKRNGWKNVCIELFDESGEIELSWELIGNKWVETVYK